MSALKVWRDPHPSVLVSVCGPRYHKHGMMIWPFTTEVERRGAILALFALQDGRGCYADLDPIDDPQLNIPGVEPSSEREQHREWLLLARSGDSNAAYYLLYARNYDWSIVRLESVV